jgi:hypothetical protein
MKEGGLCDGIEELYILLVVWSWSIIKEFDTREKREKRFFTRALNQPLKLALEQWLYPDFLLR